MRTVLVEWLHVVEVWVGANFLFGHDRAGTFSVLRTLGARYGFRAEKIDPVRYKDFVVSSTRVRRLVSEGRVDEAAALLGHHYFIDGTVSARRRPRPGDRVPDGEPRHRQRAAAAAGRLRDDRDHRRRRASVGDQHRLPSDVRRRRSRRRSRRTCSTSTAISYGAQLRLSFVQRLRDERAFPDVDALRAQIDADCRARGGCSAAFRCRIVVMAQSPGRPCAHLVLRLSVPAGDGFASVAVGSRGQGRRVRRRGGRRRGDGRRRRGARGQGRAVAAERRRRTSRSSSTRSDDELRIEARCAGRSSEVRHPLPT